MKGSFLARGGLGLAGVFLGCLGVLGGGGTAVSCASSLPQDTTSSGEEPSSNVTTPKAPETQAAPTPTPPPAPAPAPTTPPVQAQPAPSPTQPAPTPPPVKPPPVSPPPVQAQPAQTSPPAPAQPPAPIPPVGVTGPSCVIKGTSPVAKGTQIFEPGSGRLIATFTGNHTPMQLSDLPADPANGRGKIVTSTGSASVRIEGYVQVSAIPVFTARDIPVMANHVWIASAQPVKLVGATASSVSVEHTVAGSRQTVRGSTVCDALALQRGTPIQFEVPGNGRGYLTKESSIELYDRPNGDVIFSLSMLEGTSHLFWSTETKAGFVHVQSRTDLVFDGWARYRDLDPLKKGEMMDQYIPPQTGVGGAQLGMEKPPRVATASKEIAIRAKRDEKERPIGVIEPGAEFYVMETVAGWTNILPKNLYVLPHDGADFGFWIPLSEVPK